jgi:hypothetical protein
VLEWLTAFTSARAAGASPPGGTCDTGDDSQSEREASHSVQAMHFEAATMRPPGTKVPVTIDRVGASRRVVLELTYAP